MDHEAVDIVAAAGYSVAALGGLAFRNTGYGDYSSSYRRSHRELMAQICYQPPGRGAVVRTRFVLPPIHAIVIRQALEFGFPSLEL